jgi:predicted site-specific integrase-resolvase
MYKDFSEEDKKSERKNVIYARVSNTKQKEDLVRQEQVIRDYMVSNGIKVDEVYSDIASGMNAERKEFNRLLEDCISGKINTIYISYKDRFVRFGFEYFLKFLDNFDVTIEILNSTTEEDFQSELTEDLISIIHHFSMKMYSQRRKQLNAIKKELEK